MNLNKSSNNTFTTYGLILYFAVIIIGLTTYLTPLGKTIWDYLSRLGITDIDDHISNLLLSMMILFAAGSIALLNRIDWKRILLLAILIVFANFITELYITLTNTPDIVDAIYGTVGVFLALLLLIDMSKYGIRSDKIK